MYRSDRSPAPSTSCPQPTFTGGLSGDQQVNGRAMLNACGPFILPLPWGSAVSATLVRGDPYLNFLSA